LPEERSGRAAIAAATQTIQRVPGLKKLRRDIDQLDKTGLRAAASGDFAQ
jgi:hypothetical protein